MNPRIARIELRRSAAPWTGAVVLAAALAFLCLIPGPWSTGSALWTAQWTSMAMWTRHMLVFLWPLAVGLGALQGLRDRRSKMTELLAGTPRPAWHRAAAQAGTTAFTLVSAFALLLLVGAVLVLAGDASYFHLGWLPISLVGALGLGAGAVFGMGAARAMPSILTPPALAVAALMVTNFLRHHRSSDAEVPLALVPNPVALLAPTVAEVHETLLTLSAHVHLGQTVWLLGMAATGVALLAAAGPRARLLALTPLVVGGVFALLLFPAGPRDTYVVDREAAAQVCDGPVCVTTVRQARLDGMAGPAKEALRLLSGALGERAPVGVRETTALRALSATPERPRDSVLVDFDDGALAGARGERLTRFLIGQGIVPLCSPRSRTESGTWEDAAAQSIAAAWVLGERPRPLGGTMISAKGQAETSGPVWKRFSALPRAEQRERIDAAHTAALSCKGDALTELNGGALR
ncbi:hypothetical protein [Streptomyces uncialis]|uniref:hypothetical protein n=1 Tax=Streptomyces uncialis TaxID=1048205 RepID=UPI00386CEBAA|nr:hypothetical protein OG924_16595 [Streptomyces uncialis]